ncbi:9214_t:CDS:2 [Gigaspora rosea]|nr:9214_t:CDS:2 [Gigaspora rosea]
MHMGILYMYSQQIKKQLSRWQASRAGQLSVLGWTLDIQNNEKHTLTIQDSDNEDDYIKIEEDEEDDDISLWTSISDDDLDKDTLLGSESTNNTNGLLVNQKDILKDQRAK